MNRTSLSEPRVRGLLNVQSEDQVSLYISLDLLGVINMDIPNTLFRN